MFAISININETESCPIWNGKQLKRRYCSILSFTSKNLCASCIKSLVESMALLTLSASAGFAPRVLVQRPKSTRSCFGAHCAEKVLLLQSSLLIDVWFAKVWKAGDVQEEECADRQVQ